MHERGGYGSAGYGYCWKRGEAQKNLLRTHTTAVSSRMLYALAQRGFRPAKLFSIDRVFRNEAVDRTHLAEFHQVEGEFFVFCFLVSFFVGDGDERAVCCKKKLDPTQFNPKLSTKQKNHTKKTQKAWCATRA